MTSSTRFFTLSYRLIPIDLNNPSGRLPVVKGKSGVLRLKCGSDGGTLQALKYTTHKPEVQECP
jgi:hypothetical protein